ncbi:hypothetical protein ASPTUDRAFT_672869 [Aspergillus tubingensis CBS 134.48]|uniref:Uncharacterized protein n=1 Tax=Aspergillus tubingensis (strain CBS 134.48) TaxID=767770 RepID=A0A1L9MZJ4_ASPTC|nr:hypothetical protein ASPTUDRAFT_672869 [Aspergillus tubingensis CBS 134.48]
MWSGEECGQWDAIAMVVGSRSESKSLCDLHPRSHGPVGLRVPRFEATPDQWWSGRISVSPHGISLVAVLSLATLSTLSPVFTYACGSRLMYIH